MNAHISPNEMYASGSLGPLLLSRVEVEVGVVVVVFILKIDLVENYYYNNYYFMELYKRKDIEHKHDN